MEHRTDLRAWYTVKDAAAYFEVHPNTIHRWIKTGVLPDSRGPSGRPRWTRDQLLNLGNVDADQ